MEGELRLALSVASGTKTFAMPSFILGLTAFVFVPVGGRISVAELLMLPAFALTFVNRGYYVRPVRWLLLAFVTLVLGLVAGAMYFSAETDKFVSVIANYCMLTLSIIVLCGLILKSAGACVPFLLFGAALGQLAGFLISPSPSALIDPWKFSVGWAVTVIVLLIARAFRQASYGILISASAVVLLVSANFAAGSRSTAILVAVCGFFYFRHASRPNTTSNARLVILAITGFALASWLYEYTASHGLWGPEVQQKLQAQAGSLGVLFGARKELVLLLNSWLASPLLGWGPAAAVPVDVRASTYSWYAANEYEVNHSDYLRLFGVEAVPLHSVMLGSLVQAGIFAVAFCGVLAYGTYTSLRNGIASHDMAILFVALSGGVHILTSPLGDSTRFPVALCIALGFGLTKVLPPNRRRQSLD